MREIKFRDWIKKDKVIISHEFLGDMLYSNVFGYQEEAVIMQYTGLKDKNDVEIYECDIINGIAYNKEIGVGKVVYINEDACFAVKPTSTMGYYRLDSRTFEELEVIGNIYENPELLKQ